MVNHGNVSSRIMKRVSTTREARTIPLSVQKVEQASADAYRLVVAISPSHSATARLANDAEVAATISEKFDNSLRYLPQSIVRTEQAGLYTMFVRGTVPVMTKEVASTVKMVEIATNVFKDDTDCVWTMTKDADGNPIYARSDVADYAEILSAARAANIVTASLEVATAEDFQKGQIVAFYDLASESKRIGIAVNSCEVFVPETDNIIPVGAKIVLAATDDSLNVNLDGIGSAAGILDYMRAIYGKNSDLYNGLKRLVQQNLAV